MKIKQIFSVYDFHNNDGLKGINFCPICGEKLHLAKENDRNRPKCLNCDFVYYKNPVPAISVLIIDQSRVLLGKRSPNSFEAGKWCLPCGFIEYEEDFLTAAIREVKEETGLTVTIQSIINVCSNFLSDYLHSIVIVLLAKTISGTPIAGDDIESLAWFSLDGSLPELAFAADEEIIKRYCCQKIEELPVDNDFSK